MKKNSSKKFLLAVYRYFVFFALVAFIVTCCMALFLDIFAKESNIELTDINLNLAAKFTFVNVLLLSLLFTIIDALRQKFTLTRPCKKIISSTNEIMHGNFNVKIPPVRDFQIDSELNKIINCINVMAEELSHTETLRTDFISDVSHELKTPLSIIQNYAVLLKQPMLSEEKRIEYSQSIVDTSNRLADLISNILKLNKLENQQITLSYKKFDIGEQLCECLLNFEEIWESKNIQIETSIEENVTVNSDPEILSIVWNNLFSNALKFTPEGGKVSLFLSADDEKVIVKITDTGCGISNDVGKHIFDKFYQGDTSHSTNGNGLGLALVKRIIDITDSDIYVDSEVGVGTSFTVILWRKQIDKIQ